VQLEHAAELGGCVQQGALVGAVGRTICGAILAAPQQNGKGVYPVAARGSMQQIDELASQRGAANTRAILHTATSGRSAGAAVFADVGDGDPETRTREKSRVFASVVVARDAHLGGDLLIFDSGLQHHAIGQFADDAALDFLPGRLAGGIFIATGLGKIGMALVEFGG
jgi:hypothetical protein